ncbi:hypothetical protein B0H66DRAFT_603600 [Apodospora peruviana]|uniref:Uncharacterized protein n=1 Tax=Apodospora peruviana TaxID=516989 RepID=A0AAE0I5V6_9PEZI|nr:hypothetical protein B0H66DRAFT_603600 [Apodospora peruviana]
MAPPTLKPSGPRGMEKRHLREKGLYVPTAKPPTTTIPAMVPEPPKERMPTMLGRYAVYRPLGPQGVQRRRTLPRYRNAAEAVFDKALAGLEALPPLKTTSEKHDIVGAGKACTASFGADLPISGRQGLPVCTQRVRRPTRLTRTSQKLHVLEVVRAQRNQRKGLAGSEPEGQACPQNSREWVEAKMAEALELPVIMSGKKKAEIKEVGTPVKEDGLGRFRRETFR